MCEPCREKHLAYATTKRARRNHEKAMPMGLADAMEGGTWDSEQGGSATNPAHSLSSAQEQSRVPTHQQMLSYPVLYASGYAYRSPPCRAPPESELARALMYDPPPSRVPLYQGHPSAQLHSWAASLGLPTNPSPLIAQAVPVDGTSLSHPVGTSSGDPLSDGTSPTFSGHKSSPLSGDSPTTRRDDTPPPAPHVTLRVCAVKGCKSELPDEHTFKMCAPCRDKYNHYGATKRAKWKQGHMREERDVVQSVQVVGALSERTQVEGDLRSAQADGDLQSACTEPKHDHLEGAPARKEFTGEPEDVRVDGAPTIRESEADAVGVQQADARRTVDETAGSLSAPIANAVVPPKAQANLPGDLTSSSIAGPSSVPDACNAAGPSDTASSSTSASPFMRVCTISHCRQLLPEAFKYKHCDEHRAQNRRHSAIHRARRKAARAAGSSAVLAAEAAVSTGAGADAALAQDAGTVGARRDAGERELADGGAGDGPVGAEGEMRGSDHEEVREAGEEEEVPDVVRAGMTRMLTDRVRGESAQAAAAIPDIPADGPSHDLGGPTAARSSAQTGQATTELRDTDGPPPSTTTSGAVAQPINGPPATGKKKVERRRKKKSHKKIVEQRRWQACSGPGCCNLMNPAQRWRMCQFCRIRQKEGRWEGAVVEEGVSDKEAHAQVHEVGQAQEASQVQEGQRSGGADSARRQEGEITADACDETISLTGDGEATMVLDRPDDGHPAESVAGLGEQSSLAPQHNHGVSVSTQSSPKPQNPPTTGRATAYFLAATKAAAAHRKRFKLPWPPPNGVYQRERAKRKAQSAKKRLEAEKTAEASGSMDMDSREEGTKAPRIPTTWPTRPPYYSWGAAYQAAIYGPSAYASCTPLTAPTPASPVASLPSPPAAPTPVLPAESRRGPTPPATAPAATVVTYPPYAAWSPAPYAAWSPAPYAYPPAAYVPPPGAGYAPPPCPCALLRPGVACMSLPELGASGITAVAGSFCGLPLRLVNKGVQLIERHPKKFQ
ncbi:hypothetical protein HDZ31DRAFT_73633 [Schizophyllum fasciatum]